MQENNPTTTEAAAPKVDHQPTAVKAKKERTMRKQTKSAKTTKAKTTKSPKTPKQKREKVDRSGYRTLAVRVAPADFDRIPRPPARATSARG